MKIYAALYCAVMLAPLLNAAAFDTSDVTYTKDEFRIFCAMQATAQALAQAITKANERAAQEYLKEPTNGSHVISAPDLFYAQYCSDKPIDPIQDIPIIQGLILDESELTFHTPWGKWIFAQGLHCKTWRSSTTLEKSENPMLALLKDAWEHLTLQQYSNAEKGGLYVVTHFSGTKLPTLECVGVPSAPIAQPIATEVTQQQSHGPRGPGATFISLVKRYFTGSEPVVPEVPVADVPVDVGDSAPEVAESTQVELPPEESAQRKHERLAKWQAMCHDYTGWNKSVAQTKTFFW